jgi:hypothetical protein
MEAPDDQPSTVHAIDWILRLYPLKLQEISIRLQIAHGDQFGLSAGDSLCLRFMRDVYGTGKATRQNNEPLGDWSEERIGFSCDLLDIADTFSSHTDREMMNIIEMKRKLSTPLSNRKGVGANPNPLSSPSFLHRRSHPSTPLMFSPQMSSCSKARMMSEKKIMTAHPPLPPPLCLSQPTGKEENPEKGTENLPSN